MTRSKKPRLKKKCKYCKEIILITENSKRIFCNRSCHNRYTKNKPNLKRRRRAIINCTTCGNPMEVINCFTNGKLKHHFCQKLCCTEWRKEWTRKKCNNLLLTNKEYKKRMKNMAKNQWLNRSIKEKINFSKKVRDGVKEFYKNNPKPMKLCTRFGCKTKHRAKGLCFKHYMEVWNKNNPDSSCGSNIELRLVMNDVRKRDNNTCKWLNCGLTHKQSVIDVHHIFPRSEYPDLELIKEYMICYCVEHHSLWHQERGDKFFHIIKNRLNTMKMALQAGKKCRLLVTPNR